MTRSWPSVPHLTTVCNVSGCPRPTVKHGRCAAHPRTEQERGYGTEWRYVRARVRAEVKACEECGAVDRLTVDHRIPQSMGGTNERANLRVLCASCHSRMGLRSSSRGALAASDDAGWGKNSGGLSDAEHRPASLFTVQPPKSTPGRPPEIA